MKRTFLVFMLLALFIFILPVKCYAAGVDTRFDDMKEKTSSVYDAMKERVEELSKDELLADGKYGERAFLFFYDMYSAVKGVSVYIGAFSMLLGIFLCFLVRHNKQLYRNIFLCMVVGVPILLVLFCFGVGILIG